jgi:hypothetical protein
MGEFEGNSYTTIRKQEIYNDLAERRCVQTVVYQIIELVRDDN